MAFKDPQPKCLFFDVFGTCVDWRSTVTKALIKEAEAALASSSHSIPNDVRTEATKMGHEEWGQFAAEWRKTYYEYTKSIVENPDQPYKTIDEHHYDALNKLLLEHKLTTAGTGSLWTDDEIRRISLIWHFLDPWTDTPKGLAELNKRYTTSTLSNGNVSLLTDMVKHARMPFAEICSSEMFHSYKPSPKVYLGAAKRLGFEPEECALVAAHLKDLRAARNCGFKTVYVERLREESDPELKNEEGLVDVWVSQQEDGFIAVARKLGIDVEEQPQ